MNKLFTRLLPTELTWIEGGTLRCDKEVIKKLSNSYKECLIAKQYNGDYIKYYVGWIQPKNNYTEFDIMAKLAGIGKDYPDHKIEVSDVTLVGIALLNWFTI